MRASSCARTTTLRARSVNRSNIGGYLLSLTIGTPSLSAQGPTTAYLLPTVMGGWPAFLLAVNTAAHNFTDETQPQQSNAEKRRNVSPAERRSVRHQRKP